MPRACAVWGRHGNAGRRTPVRVCGAQQHASRVRCAAGRSRRSRRSKCRHHPGPGPARPWPAWAGARPAGARRAPRGRDRATPRDRWITYHRLKLSQPVKSSDFLMKMCVVNGGKYAFGLSGLVPNSWLSGSRGTACTHIWIRLWQPTPDAVLFFDHLLYTTVAAARQRLTRRRSADGLAPKVVSPQGAAIWQI